MVFFFNDTATTEIYTLSLHDALPIFNDPHDLEGWNPKLKLVKEILLSREPEIAEFPPVLRDRKSTRLNSSHSQISYAVFCLKKKNLDHLVDDVYAQACEYGVLEDDVR